MKGLIPVLGKFDSRTEDHILADSSQISYRSTTVEAALDSASGSSALLAQDVSLTSDRWVSSGISEYPYKAEIHMPGVTANYFPILQFSDEDSALYEFSSSVVPSTDTITIYCKTSPTTTIVVPTILCLSCMLVTAT